MILGQNHLVIVPDTRDEVARVGKVYTSTVEDLDIDVIKIDLFGDDLMFGRDPDQEAPMPGVGSLDNYTARIPTPPHELIKVFLPQFQLDINNRAVGNTASGDLLNGSDGVNSTWPDNVTANIVVINHGLQDAKANVDIETYKENLIALRQGIANNQIMVWQTPAPALTVNTAPYADAMIQVANQFNDLVADTRKITNWTNELPDGEYPRQLGYARWIDLVLSEKINSAILKHLGPNRHKFYRLDHQEKFILDNENTITLSFRPLAASWVEVYHRKNDAYYAVSRGNVDIATNPVNNISGHLAGGIHSVDTGEQLVTVTKGYTLTKIRRSDGKIISKKTFDIAADVKNARAMSFALNETSNDYIVVITTYDEPKTNRLTAELLEAMYRCGASEEIYANPEFRLASSYILIGIPGVGPGGGLEAYAGLVDNDRYAYAEIEFEIASNGVPYARDIFPPVARVQRSWDNIVPVINPIYDLIAGVPPINGERVVNPRYSTYFTSGVANETFVIQGNTITFTEALTGVVTVICDTQIELSKAGVEIDIDNIHTYDTFEQSFNPARWAPGKKTTTYPAPDPNNPLAPRQVNSAAGVNALGLYNTHLRERVGAGLYCEPIVIHQPNFGYVRITADRKRMKYFPFPNFVGMDGFSYTLMTQHGQVGLTKAVYIDVTEALTPSYRLSADKNSINEGETVTITLTTTVLENGTTVPYLVTGISLNDFVNTPLSGNFIVNNNTSTVSFTPIRDMTTEGPEFLTLTLTGIYPTKRISIEVNDTSKTPVITLEANVAIANEGDVVRFTARADDIVDGTSFQYIVSGITADDVVEPLSGTITFLANVWYTDYTIIRDSKTEGSETMTMQILNSIPLISNSVFITDTSLDPTYHLYSNVGIVNEGQAVKFYVNTTDVMNGTRIPYTITGIGSDDIQESFIDSFTVYSNYAESVIHVRNDRKTEGTEIMVMTLNGIPATASNVITTSVLINDTSLAPTYKLFSNVNVVDEGGSIKFYVQTTEVDTGTYVDFDITGISSTDIIGPLTGRFVINNSYAELVVKTRQDRTTEGPETLTLTLQDILATGGNIIAANVNINDTSLTPHYALSSNVASVDEGQSIKFILNTENVFDGERVYYTITGINSTDILQPLDGVSFVISGNTAEVVITTVADRTTEGNEVITLSLDNISPSGNITSSSVTIVDTSKAPTFNVSANVASANEGSSIEFTLLTTEVDDGTRVNYQITNLSDLVGTVSSTGYFTVQGNVAYSPVYTFKEDKLTEGTETFTLSLIGISSTAPNVITSSVSILDTSTAPVLKIESNKLSVDEGSSVTFRLTVVSADLPDGTVIPYRLDGLMGLNLNEDLTGVYDSNYTHNGTFTIVDSKASVSFVTVADLKTEGQEMLRLTVLPGFVVDWVNNVSYVSVIVNDTSVAPSPPTYSITFSPTSIYEGQSTTATITCFNFPIGGSLSYSITGFSPSTNLVSPATGTLTPSANVAYLIIETQRISGFVSSIRYPVLTVTGPSSSTGSGSFAFRDAMGCGEIINLSSVSASYTIDLGTKTGVFGINYDASTIPDSFSISWNGVVRSATLVSGTGQLRISKASAYPTTATVTFTPGQTGSSATITIYCALN